MKSEDIERRGIEAFIFDMDGVIVDTAGHHYSAWRTIASEFSYEFTQDENEQLKGLSRMDSLDALLDMIRVSVDQDEKQRLCDYKNKVYLDLVANLNASAILPGVMPLLQELDDLGLQYAVGSASKNARPILRAIGLIDTYEVIIDGNDVLRSKPDPEVFLKAADAMRVTPQSCVVIEDSHHGVRAARDGGFYVLGIGDRSILSEANHVVPSLQGITASDIIDYVTLSEVAP